MRKTPISVVLATYNGAAFLPEQLESIAAQTLEPTEVIIRDDGSTDETLAIAEKFRKCSGLNVMVLVGDGGEGYAANFLKACASASSELIAFCDQDDVWERDKLARCEAAFDDPAVVLAVHSATLIDALGKEIGEFDQGLQETRTRGPLSYDLWGTFWGFSMVFRRQLLDLVPPGDRFEDYNTPGRLIAHDRWVCFLAQMVGSTREIAEPLARYRQHSSNQFGAKSLKTTDLADRSKRYASATEGMLAAVLNFDTKSWLRPSTVLLKRDLEVLRRAVRFSKFRAKLHGDGARLSGLLPILGFLIAGGYRDPVRPHIRFRSLVRDVQFCLRPRRTVRL